ncbi:MAG: hypothetical protein D6802_02080 [Ardenticatenia bacterium]|uniref:Uncharacterized protein n=1 Tax=Ardenticatena maritima TaxID=872965 RepID=A0A0M8K974_9CHLR|nr:hypothetical protein [Ardenticatena maritima]KPL89187.1 hypothetical protein SE16_01395 [Ardenticatena maritima]RME13245.1 MAG: hypothetical protein D6802_02080 [Ardenticatenia bacterium]GAP62866.1 hypothetical protein ARMA_1289 [Ardenticatena maritima]
MNRQRFLGQRLAALAIVGFLLLNYPILSLVNRPHLLGGIPVLYIYLFGVWLGLIWCMAFLLERR